MTEASHDPTDEIHARIDADDNAVPVKPLQHLARLAAAGSLSPDERDAGEILYNMARQVRAASPPPRGAGLTTPARYSHRDTDGKWSTISESRGATTQRVTAALASIRTDKRRRAVTHCLVADQPRADVTNTAPLVAGIEDVARHFWGRKAPPVHMAALMAFGDARLVAANDNKATGSRLVVEGFERMAARGQLDSDHTTNETLHHAGLRYQAEFHRSRLEPLGAIDYSRVRVGGGDETSEVVARAKDAVRGAHRAMGTRFAAVVDAVVLNGRTLTDVGLEVSGYRHERAAGAVASDRLNTGLRLLAMHYGMMRKAA